jgi:hypothetical protein
MYQYEKEGSILSEREGGGTNNNAREEAAAEQQQRMQKERRTLTAAVTKSSDGKREQQVSNHHCTNYINRTLLLHFELLRSICCSKRCFNRTCYKYQQHDDEDEVSQVSFNREFKELHY